MKVAGNRTNEFLAASTAKVSTIVVASASQDDQCLHGGFPTPFANAPGRRKVDGNRLTKFVFNVEHSYPPGACAQFLTLFFPLRIDHRYHNALTRTGLSSHKEVTKR